MYALHDSYCSACPAVPSFNAHIFLSSFPIILWLDNDNNILLTLSFYFCLELEKQSFHVLYTREIKALFFQFQQGIKRQGYPMDRQQE